MFKKLAVIASLTIILSNYLSAQQIVPVGRGSYASFTPLSQGRTDEHWGDLSTQMQSRQLWVTERHGQPIPTNDWWTGLINAPFADALWSYPQCVHPSSAGVSIYYPSHWNENGTEMKWDTSVEVRGANFTAESAIADRWHDWDVTMVMSNADCTKRMTTTMVHGIPMTWIELDGIEAQIVASERPTLMGTGSKLCLKVGNDCYGIYLPPLYTAKLNYRTLRIKDHPDYIVIALLPDEDYIDDFAQYAYNKPVNTRVDWSYDEQKAEITSRWSVETVNLKNGSMGGSVLQGFLPHLYKSAVNKPALGTLTYATPRGKMKMAEGTHFTFTHKFYGMLPWFGTPHTDETKENAFNPGIMNWMIERYARNGEFGADTYWGGKGLMQMALNMTFALQTGNTEMFELSRDKLKSVLVNWLTYTPGEDEFFFAYYPRWGGLVGQKTSYDSDTFNDHHFHYGYFTLAGAILAMVDRDFANRYGDMLKEIAKDYANWDREDIRYPFLRTMDPWVGHSYAGGLGDQGNSNGNGQESSSESMQGWGGLYMLGVALNDKAMRDAGIFGWSMEARATREYWFDVDARVQNPRFDFDGEGANYDHNLYPYPYNSNITCKGIGWWTWFGGDPLFMHGIQWLPISPALDYLSWDKGFVEWAYNDLVNNVSWPHHWFEDTMHEDVVLEALANNDWGNVALSYMQRSNPDEAAAILDRAWAEQKHIATAVSTSHISYYVTHSHRTLGEQDLDIHADIPSAAAYCTPEGKYTYIVYNPDNGERVVNFYKDGAVIKSVKAPARKFTEFVEDAAAQNIVVTSESGNIFLGSSLMKATAFDQYGTSVEGLSFSWSVSPTNVGSIDNNGLFTINNGVARGTKATITASSESLSGKLEITINEPSKLTTGTIKPEISYVEKGSSLQFELDAYNQYGNVFEGDVTWKYDNIEIEDTYIECNMPGMHTITATAVDKSMSRTFMVTPRLPNVATGKPTYSSSEENVGTQSSYVNDGNRDTRWGSAHKDGEWIYIDLGSTHNLTRIEIEWEAAYASRYLIQIAREGAATMQYTGQYGGVSKTYSVIAENEWNTLEEANISSAGNTVHNISASARYVRIKALERGSVYGVSIKELGIFGFAADAAPTTVIGVDIVAENDFIDEGDTIQLNATGYLMNGNAVDVSGTWSTDNGTMDASGRFTPETYGEATVKFETASGFAAIRRFDINEVIKLTKLNVTPSAMRCVLNEAARFKIEGLNQFSGIYEFASNELIIEAPSNISVDLSNGLITATEPGHYTVTFKSGNIEANLPVEVVSLSEINLALGRPVTSGSENIASSNATDGNADTRWQAKPGDAQWIYVELDGTYLINRVGLTWEASLAEEYTVDVSVDGRNWIKAATSTTRPQPKVMQNIALSNPLPAKYVRIMPTRLSETAINYGASLFEIEVYGIERLEGEDNVAPAYSTIVFIPSGKSIVVKTDATDESEYILLTASAHRGDFAVNAGACGSSGEELAIELTGLNDQTTYVVVARLSDVFGNSIVVVENVTTTTGDYGGINLALNRPTTAGSWQNAGFAPNLATDGNISSRWQARPGEEQWLCVELNSEYYVNMFKVTWETACAKEYDIEVSRDGLTWETVASNNATPISGQAQTLSCTPTAAKFVRVQPTTLSDAGRNYGVSIFEFEVYANARVVSDDDLVPDYTYIDDDEFPEPDPEDYNSVENVTVDAPETLVNVYDITGRLIRVKVSADEATKNLPRGVYLVNRRKIVI